MKIWAYRAETIPNNEEPSVFSFLATIENLPDDTILMAEVKITGFVEGVELNYQEEVPVYKVATEPVSLYTNDFDADLTDFARLGFNIFQARNFTNNALHSLHPYDGASEYISVLQIPIQIESENTKLTFDEVVLVETGDDEVFGLPEFYDYVIIEATKDGGASWDTLVGYDSNDRDIWVTAYNNNRNGRSNLFVERTIPLGEFYERGEQVYLRFRLVSDAFVEGWGWAIDNLNIGGETVSTNEVPKKAFELEVFPNPASEVLFVNYKIEDNTFAQVDILNTKGQTIEVLQNGQVQFPGQYSLEIQVNHLPAGGLFCTNQNGRGGPNRENFDTVES